LLTVSVQEIEREVAALGEKARHGSLTAEDMRGGTFTISNGGAFGSLLSTPILNQPQSAILGMHAVKNRPMAVNRGGVFHVEVRPMMNLALSYDHRLVDGRDAALFLKRVGDKVENPSRLLLSL
jgi:2-oxoglutarate dehydrogenase E2 component (dihydrolipoamide succinyltransferase)